MSREYDAAFGCDYSGGAGERRLPWYVAIDEADNDPNEIEPDDDEQDEAGDDDD